MPLSVTLIMGVSGTGKSTIAQLVASKLNYSYLDADDFHSEQAKEMMANGQAITDEIRIAWITNMLMYLANEQLKSANIILAYSGLKQAQRKLFKLLDTKLSAFFLYGDKALIAKRLANRQQHFFATSLLDSQFQALELPHSDREEQYIQLIDINASVEQIVEYIVKQLTN